MEGLPVPNDRMLLDQDSAHVEGETMKRLAVLLFGAALVFVLLGSLVPIGRVHAAAAEPEGLLVGFRCQEPEERPHYASYFLIWENDKVRAAEPVWPGGPGGKGLMVARKTGFWGVAVPRLKYNDMDEEHLAAGPVEKDLVFPAPLRFGFAHYNQQTCDVLFVSGQYIAVKEWQAAFGYGAAHPNEYNSLSVYSLDDLKHRLPIDKVLGSSGLGALNGAAKAYLSKSNNEGLADSAESSDWAVERGSGQWELRGLIGYSYEVFKGTHAIFGLPVIPPSTLVEYDRLVPAWPVIQRSVPKAVDAFTSPRGRLLVVQVPGKLLFFSRPTEKDIGQPAGQLEIPAGARAVMAQWAVGSYVRKWEEAFLAHFFGQEPGMF